MSNIASSNEIYDSQLISNISSSFQKISKNQNDSFSEKSIKEYQEKQIGNYFLEKEIGSGGFAKVYLGIHILTNEKVAIKILNYLTANGNLKDKR